MITLIRKTARLWWVAAALMCLRCGDSNMLSPGGVNYSVAVGTFGGPWIFEVDLLTNNVDSFRLSDEPIHRMVSSGKSRRLYVPFADSVALIELGESSGSSLWRGYPSGGISLSRNEKYLAVFGPEFAIIDLSDGSTVFNDVDGIWSGAFSSDEEYFYAIVPPPNILSRVIQRIDLKQKTATKIGELPEECFAQIIASKQPGRFYLHYPYGKFTYKFVHFDALLDTVLFSAILRPGYGRMAVSEDEDYLFLTNPGTFVGDPEYPEPVPFIEVYDCQGHQFFELISTQGMYGDDWDATSDYIGEIEVTGDGRYVVGLGEVGRGIIVIGTATLAPERYLKFARRRSISAYITTHPRF